MTAIAVTDTHALIWYALGRWKKLGSSARAFFESADAGKAVVYVPAIVIVELLEADQRGVISLRGGAATWVDGLLRGGSFFDVPLTAAIALESRALYGIPERGDRLIAATAVHLGYPLITRDGEIARMAGIELLW